MTDLEIMHHRFSHKNIKSNTGKLAKELGVTTAEYTAAVRRGLDEEDDKQGRRYNNERWKTC